MEPCGSLVTDSRTDSIFFAQQDIQNACATQALLNLVMNVDSQGLHIGPMLTDFRAFTSGFDAANKGLSLSNSEQIRALHNSFSRQQVLDLDLASSEKEEVYHFVAYVPIKGHFD